MQKPGKVDEKGKEKGAMAAAVESTEKIRHWVTF